MKFAREVEKRLSRSGIYVIRDENSFPIGSSLINDIGWGLKHSHFVIPIYSKKFFESNWTREELDATKYEEVSSKIIKLLPLKIEACDIPYLYKRKIFLHIKGPSTYEADFKKLISFIKSNYRNVEFDAAQNESIISHLQAINRIVTKKFQILRKNLQHFLIRGLDILGTTITNLGKGLRETIIKIGDNAVKFTIRIFNVFEILYPWAERFLYWCSRNSEKLLKHSLQLLIYLTFKVSQLTTTIFSITEVLYPWLEKHLYGLTELSNKFLDLSKRYTIVIGNKTSIFSSYLFSLGEILFPALERKLYRLTTLSGVFIEFGQDLLRKTGKTTILFGIYIKRQANRVAKYIQRSRWLFFWKTKVDIHTKESRYIGEWQWWRKHGEGELFIKKEQKVISGIFSFGELTKTHTINFFPKIKEVSPSIKSESKLTFDYSFQEAELNYESGYILRGKFKDEKLIEGISLKIPGIGTYSKGDFNDFSPVGIKGQIRIINSHTKLKFYDHPVEELLFTIPRINPKASLRGFPQLHIRSQFKGILENHEYLYKGWLKKKDFGFTFRPHSNEETAMLKIKKHNIEIRATFNNGFPEYKTLLFFKGPRSEYFALSGFCKKGKYEGLVYLHKNGVTKKTIVFKGGKPISHIPFFNQYRGLCFPLLQKNQLDLFN